MAHLNKRIAPVRGGGTANRFLGRGGAKPVKPTRVPSSIRPVTPIRKPLVRTARTAVR